MAPEPPHRQLLSQLFDALKRTTSRVVQDESIERRTINDNMDSGYGSIIKARILNANRDLGMLKAAADLLEQQRAVLERLNAYAHNAAQPICRLPDEILSNIFEVGLSSATYSWAMDPRKSKKESRWTHLQYRLTRQSVGATCSQIRAAQIDTPRCWTHCDCLITGSNVRLAGLDLMLKRSKNCHFTLILQMFGGPPSGYALQAISDLLLPHIHRCYDLRLASDDHSTTLLGLIPPALFSGLQHIKFHWMRKNPWALGQESSVPEAVVSSWMAAIKSPLRSICIRGFSGLIEPMHKVLDNIPSQALTSLRLNVYCSNEQVLRLLQRCATLEHLFWDVFDEIETADNMEDMAEEPPQQIMLSHLISLHIPDPIGRRNSFVLYAPQLKQIRLTGDYNITPIDILHPQQPPLPSLSQLHLSQPVVSDQLGSFLHRNPQVVECVVDIHTCRSDDGLDDVRGVVEPFLYAPSDIRASVSRHLRHLSLSLEFPTGENLESFEREITELLESLLLQFPELCFSLHDRCAGPIVETEKISLEFRDPTIQSRVLLNPPCSVEETWPSAWDSTSV